MSLQGNSGISSQGHNYQESFLSTREKQRQLLYSREKRKKIQELKFSQCHQDPREGERESNSGNTFQTCYEQEGDFK